MDIVVRLLPNYFLPFFYHLGVCIHILGSDMLSAWHDGVLFMFLG